MDSNCEIKQKPNGFKELVRSWLFWKPALSVIIGGIVGFLYYYFVGCTTGTCAITSSPYSSTIMGSVLGLFITNSPCSQNRCSR
jgi:hypothetical protein